MKQAMASLISMDNSSLSSTILRQEDLKATAKYQRQARFISTGSLKLLTLAVTATSTGLSSTGTPTHF